MVGWGNPNPVELSAGAETIKAGRELDEVIMFIGESESVTASD